MLHQWESGGCLPVAPGFLVRGVGRVVGRDHINAVVVDRRPECLLVGGRLDRRIARDVGALGRIRRIVEKEMVDAGFRRDPLIGQVSRCKQVQLPGRRDVQHVEPRVVARRQLDGEARRLIARVYRANERMFRERDVVPVPGPGGRLVRGDGRRVLAVGGDDEGSCGEDGVERALVVDQHVAGAGPHEDFDTACQPPVDGLDGLQVVIGRAKVEPVVRH